MTLHLSNAQSNSQNDRIKIKGKIKCRGQYRIPPDFEIIVFDGADYKLKNIQVDTYKHPYYFSGYVNSSHRSDLLLKFVSNSDDSLVSYPEPVSKYSGNLIEIRVKNIKHVRDDYFVRARGFFEHGRYLRAIEEIEKFRTLYYLNAFNDSQDYKWSYLLAKSHEALTNYTEASLVLTKLLNRRNMLDSRKKYKIYKYLSQLYFIDRNYQKQLEILDKISTDIGLKNISHSNVKLYFKERLTNLLRRANYFDEAYQVYPGKFLENSFKTMGRAGDVSLSEWKKFYKEWINVEFGTTEGDKLPLLDQIEKAITRIDGD